MSGQQFFCLRWNNYQENLTCIFDRLLQNEALVDVTLYIGGKSIRAHKTILSACSPYFEKMFMENTHPHPIVVLQDFIYDDVKGLLDFMYKGEVNVTQDRLGTFIKAAETLEVRGLASDDRCDKEKTPNVNGICNDDVEHSSPPPKRKRRQSFDDGEVIQNNHHEAPPPSIEDNNSESQLDVQYRHSPTLVDHGMFPLQGSSQVVEQPSAQSDVVAQRDVNVQLSTTTANNALEQPTTVDASIQLENQHPDSVPEVKQEPEEDEVDDEKPEVVDDGFPQDDSSNAAYGEQLNETIDIDLGVLDGGEGTSSGHGAHIQNYFNLTPDGKFMCVVCSSSIAYTRNLRKHLDTHLPAKFGCEACGRKFKQRSHLKRHLMSVCKLNSNDSPQS